VAKVKFCNPKQLWHGERMTEIPDPKPPKCNTMPEVHAGIDYLDQRIVALFKIRFDYMKAAARLAHDRSAICDKRRNSEVLANVAYGAGALGLDQALIKRVYKDVIETCDAYALEVFDRTRTTS
jgi:chorismate mutase